MGAPRLQFTHYLLTPLKSRACHNNRYPRDITHTHTDRKGMSGKRKEGERKENLKLWHFTYTADHKGFFEYRKTFLPAETKREKKTEMENVKCVSLAGWFVSLVGQLVWVHSRLPQRET